MTKEELYELLELDTPEDFTYFEQMADLIETEDDIPLDLFKDVLSLMDSDTAGTLIENYFEDFNKSIPDADDDFVCLVESVKQGLLLAAEDIENTRNDFVERLFYFRNWLHKDGGALIDELPTSVLTAVIENRCDQLGSSTHKYYFPSVADYELEDLSLGLGKYEKIDILNDKDEDNTEDFDN